MADNRANQTEALRDWEQRRQEQLAAGLTLVQRWVDTFPVRSVRFRLVRLAGESNTLLRWRRCARVQNAPHGSRFELADDPTVLLALPKSVRTVVLDYERRRLAINYDYAIAAYRVQRLRALQTLQAALAELRRLDRETS